ncbi:50S ribosomal protein L3 [Candidatus Woesebacteria bacterium]|nr:50S ribosomal protein L3 [Candidatus Woesebacteria bacterium]MCD8507645.1 50S ribosomal protein L3 [Candidatus Woesebacteria bacterium]MCD8526769.1 50S ribosomal protein L3 [Candidatus Woesebacteria bacterium]MCD8546485.1 50S ribosomal protein L3 [Candidatus Woesebacteria bacterium]
MVDTVLAQKKDMRQVWTENGTRLVVTKLYIGGNVVVRTVSQEDDSTQVQIAFGDKKMHNMAKAQQAQLAAAKIEAGKRVFLETTATEELNPGRILLAEEVVQAGDTVKVTATSKGKGFTGVVKRWGFAGGPKTHGQSDRQRAPGSIGAGTTPGRVWPGKKMAGRSGGDTVTLENVSVVAVNPSEQVIWVKGTIPGAYNTIVTLRKQGAGKDIALNDFSKAELGVNAAEVAATEDSTEETQA